MKYLLSAAVALVLAGCNAESNAATAATDDQAPPVPQIVGNADQPAGAMPPGNPMLAQLAEMGGAAEAGIELCGMQHDVAAAKRQQREQFIQMGGSAAAFDAGYQAGYDRARGEFQAASASEQQRMCEGYREFEASREGGDW